MFVAQNSGNQRRGGRRSGGRQRSYAPQPNAYKMYGGTAAVVVAAFVGYLMYIGVVWWVAYFVAINVVTFLMFGFDKAIASGSFMRVPERVLFALALFGASPALLLGQKVFRHKTVKPSFQFIFWLIVVVQLGLLAYFGYGEIVPGANVNF